MLTVLLTASSGVVGIPTTEAPVAVTSPPIAATPDASARFNASPSAASAAVIACSALHNTTSLEIRVALPSAANGSPPTVVVSQVIGVSIRLGSGSTRSTALRVCALLFLTTNV